MSVSRELIAAVTSAVRQIDDQMAKLHAYSGQIQTITTRVDTALRDSNTEADRKMLDQLSQTKQQVDDTVNKLQAAKERLQTLNLNI